MTSVRASWTPEDGEPIEFEANLTIRVVPATASADETMDGGELTFTRREGPPLELLPRRQRFEVARFPNGSTLVREVPVSEDDQ